MSRIGLSLIGCLLLMANSAVAQVYENEDAQGNTVFSDAPSPGSEQLELPAANIADAPPEIPESAPAEPTGDGPNIVVIPNSHNEKVEQEWREGQRVDVRETEPRREVREAEPRHEVRNAEPRHEAQD